VAAEQFSETVAQLFHTQITLDLARNCQADHACLLGNDYGDGIGFLGNANARAMPRPQLSGKHRVHGQGQKARSSRNAVILYDHSAVM
jgi:hypothetical protein